MKKLICLFFIFCFLSVTAHEFWLQPDKFIYKKGETANIKFKVGENFEGENWSGDKTKVKSLKLYQLNSFSDISSLVSDKKGDSIFLPLQNEGTMVIAYNSLNSFIKLEPAKFNAYLKEDGLTDAITYRRQHNETDSTGHEFYQRSVKTIIQVGKQRDSTSNQTTDLPLDIIPLKNPYSLKQGDTLTIKILFQKKPLVNHKIRVWQKQKNLLANPELITDKNGEIKFPVSLNGHWMVSTVQMVHLDNEAKANWQSYWGSCTWGYE